MGQRTRSRIVWALGIVPAAVLLFAAIHKGLDPSLFAEQITAHKVTPPSWSTLLAHLFVAVELIIGGALLSGFKPRWTHLAFILLMLGFIVATAIAWAHGNTKECGCFGRAVGRGPEKVIIQDALLIVLSAVAMILAKGIGTSRIARRIAFPWILLSIAFSAAGARIPADAFVTGLRAGSDMGDLPIEDLRKPHTDGWSFLILLDGGCTACPDAIAPFRDLAKTRKDLAMIAVFSGTRQDAMTWRLQHLPPVAVAHASPRALRAYYREIPSCFLLRDGRLVRAFWNRIPIPAEIEGLLPPAPIDSAEPQGAARAAPSSPPAPAR